MKTSESNVKTIIEIFSLGSRGLSIAYLIIKYVQFYFYYCLNLVDTFCNAKWKSKLPNQLMHSNVMHVKLHGLSQDVWMSH